MQEIEKEKIETEETEALALEGPSKDEANVDTEPEKAKKPRRGDKRRWAAPLGAASLVLALIGAVSLIGSGVRLIAGMVERSCQETYTTYAEFIQPVVLYDPKPFNSIADAQGEDLFKAAYWAAQLAHNNSNEADYEQITLSDGSVRYRMPIEEILTQGRRLFGIDLTPQSFTIDGILYEYNDAEGQLYVPLNTHNGLYTPKVTAVRKKDGKVELTVGYISTMSVGTDPQPVKTMIYTLREDQREWTVAAIANMTS